MTNNFTVDFGKRVRERRLELGLSQEELAIKMGYKSRSTINKIEMGKNTVPVKTIKALANALEVDPLFLIGQGEDIEKPTTVMSSELSPDEIEIIKVYRASSQEKRFQAYQAAMDILRSSLD